MKYYDKIKKIILEFHEPTALIVTSIIWVTLFFTVINPAIEYELNFVLRTILFGFILTLIAGFWLTYKFRFPRFRSKGKIGIILSIYSENEKDLLQLKFDVVNRVKKNILCHELTDSVAMLIIPNHLSEKIHTHADILNAHKKTGGHLFIQGRIKKRRDETEKNFVDLEGRVIHAPVEKTVSNILSREFRDALPPEIIKSPDFQMEHIRITSDTISECSEYIIGLAALISGDIFTAIKFHKKLLESLENKNSLTKSEENLKQRTINNLAFENITLATHYLKLGDHKKFQDYYAIAKTFKMEEYGVLLFDAIEKFQNNKITEAKEDINKAKKVAYGRQDWRYSQAFLSYWSEDFENAYDYSKKIVEHDDVDKLRLANQAILFNLPLLKEKQQLNFWIAFLYYKCLNNITMAHKYFSVFQDNAIDKKFDFLKDKSKVYLREIEKEIGVSN